MRVCLITIAVAVACGAVGSSWAWDAAQVPVAYAKVKKMPAATPLRSLRKERCLIATDGKIHYRGPCTVAEWDKDETHITKVGRTPMIGAIIYTHQFSVWNGPEGESHLHGSLGDMRREGSCWITRAKPRFDVPTYSVRGRVCAR